MKHSSLAKDILFGVATGDALGVPVEFKSREAIYRNPVTDMIGYGTYDQPAGTWSDDSSLTFCLAEALAGEFTLDNLAENFIRWIFEGYWTPYGDVFDVGIATKQAIIRLKKGTRPELAGGFEVHENGNGSLMRILPLLVLIMNKPMEERFALTKQVSSVTHCHIRSVTSCFYYLEFARLLATGVSKQEAYLNLQGILPAFLHSMGINVEEIRVFDSLLKGDIATCKEGEIQSSGYVLHTLEASIWCLLTTDSYKEAVLKAVNLGSDTDTTGAVTGGLAGILYGSDDIPKPWVDQLARKEEIDDLATRLQKRLSA